jgi:hypothetical protein
MQPDPHALAHEHSDRCWWDLDEARWSCPPLARTVALPVQALPVEHPVAGSGMPVGAFAALP